MKKLKNNKLPNTKLFLGVAIALGISVLFYLALTKQPVNLMSVLANSDQVVISQHRTDTEWHLKNGKPYRPQLGPDQDIRLRMVTTECTKSVTSTYFSHLQFKLNEAFLIPTIRDLDPQTIASAAKRDGLDSHYDHYLIIQGWAKNTAFPPLFADQFYPKDILKLKRANRTFDPFIYGTTNVPVQELRAFWAIFPVTASETQFTLSYCPSPTPIDVPLDFTQQDVTNLKGNFSIDFGLYLPQ